MSIPASLGHCLCQLPLRVGLSLKCRIHRPQRGSIFDIGLYWLVLLELSG